MCRHGDQTLFPLLQCGDNSALFLFFTPPPPAEESETFSGFFKRLQIAAELLFFTSRLTARESKQEVESNKSTGEEHKSISPCKGRFFFCTYMYYCLHPPIPDVSRRLARAALISRPSVFTPPSFVSVSTSGCLFSVARKKGC